ncbi:MAG: transcription termination/antitermination protein NusG, partial [Candidatus Neomarinimicrobiota bacterium]
IIINIEEAELKDEITDVLVPAENIVEMKDGKKKIKNKVFFPGYILIKMNLNNKTRYLVENINGVLSFVGPKGAPQIVKAEEMIRILGEVEGRDGKEVLSVPYRVGDSVKVTDGPFMDFSGFVQDVSKEKQKIKVSVSIFGRPTPIELDFLQVELEK